MRVRALPIALAALLAVPATAQAHVELTPDVAAPGGDALFTVKSPNESTDQPATTLSTTATATATATAAASTAPSGRRLRPSGRTWRAARLPDMCSPSLDQRGRYPPTFVTRGSVRIKIAVQPRQS